MLYIFRSKIEAQVLHASVELDPKRGIDAEWEAVAGSILLMVCVGENEENGKHLQNP